MEKIVTNQGEKCLVLLQDGVLRAVFCTKTSISTSMILRSVQVSVRWLSWGWLLSDPSHWARGVSRCKTNYTSYTILHHFSLFFIAFLKAVWRAPRAIFHWLDRYRLARFARIINFDILLWKQMYNSLKTSNWGAIHTLSLCVSMVEVSPKDNFYTLTEVVGCKVKRIE